MRVSRRRLLKNSVFAALAGLVSPIASWSAKKPSPGATWQGHTAASGLNHLSRQSFTQVIGTGFKVLEEGGNSSPVYLRLITVEDLPAIVPVNVGAMAVPPPRTGPTPKTEGFVLIFTGSLPKPLPQGTYIFEHSGLGSFDLLITPGSPGSGTYIAVINRLV